MPLALGWWQQILLLPGITFMDWFVRQFPYFVIRTGVGFSMESYIYWVIVVSAAFWAIVLILLVLALRYLLFRRDE